MATIKSLTVKKLGVSPDNIRKSPATEAQDEELKASIDANGVFQNLIVTKAPRGKYLVHDGARRLSAVAALIKEKKLPANYELSCLVLDANENAEEAALAGNTIRAPMHPIDEFEAYHRLHHDRNMAVEEIAAHFGRSPIDIRKRLALAGVAPELRERCRAGEIRIDALAAFTITDDHERQLACYEQIASSGHSAHINAHNIRHALTETYYKSDDKLVVFIGLDNYKAQGGTTSSDLFQEMEYLHDTAMVESMVKAKLSTIADELADEGWKWVEINLEYETWDSSYIEKYSPTLNHPPELIKKAAKLEEEQEALYEKVRDLEGQELKAAESRIEEIDDMVHDIETDLENPKYEEWDPKVKAKSGCVIKLNHRGELQLHAGLVRKEDIKAQSKKSASNAAAGEPEEQPAMSQALLSDLHAYRRTALQTDLMYSFELVYDLLHFSLAYPLVIGNAWAATPLKIDIRPVDINISVTDARIENTRAELLDALAKLETDWASADAPVESFQQFRELGSAARAKLMAWCVARILLSDEFEAELLRTLTRTNIAKYWRPSAANYFKRAPKPQLLIDGSEIFQDENFAQKHAAKSKGDLAAMLEERIEQMEVSDCWLPALMRAGE